MKNMLGSSLLLVVASLCFVSAPTSFGRSLHPAPKPAAFQRPGSAFCWQAAALIDNAQNDAEVNRIYGLVEHRTDDMICDWAFGKVWEKKNYSSQAIAHYQSSGNKGYPRGSFDAAYIMYEEDLGTIDEILSYYNQSIRQARKWGDDKLANIAAQNIRNIKQYQDNRSNQTPEELPSKPQRCYWSDPLHTSCIPY